MNRISSFATLLFSIMLLTACSSKSDKLAQIAKEANEYLGTPKELVPGLMTIERIESDDETIIYKMGIMQEGMVEGIKAVDNFALKRTLAGLLKNSASLEAEMKRIGFNVKFRYVDPVGNLIREISLSPDELENSKELSTEEYIDIQVAQTSKTLPTRVDEITVMTGISRDGNTMVYRYDCDIDLIEQGVTPEIMKDVILPSLGSLGDNYRRMNVSLRYCYYYNGVEQVRVDISSDEM